MKKILFLLPIIGVLVSCENNKTTSTKDSKTQVNITIDTIIDSLLEATPATITDTTALAKKPSQDENDLKTQELLTLFAQRKQQVSDSLKIISKTEANKLYDLYIIENQRQFTSKLDETESDILNRFYNDDLETKNLIKIKEEELLKHGLKFDETGEGDVEITTKNDFYYNIFKNYVTDDYKDYLEIKKEEDKSRYSADAGLSITFKEVGDRIAVWERYMAKYPNSALILSVKEAYKGYQYDYIIGMDNTPTFESVNPEKKFINPENLEEFKRFKTKYPASPTIKLIDFLMLHFKDENIRKLLENEQSKF